MSRIAIDFSHYPSPWWRTILAWAVVIALFFCFLRYCMKPVLAPFAAALKESGKEKP